MKKSDLKEIIKPLVKECIHEVLIEEGHLANIVTEVAKGMQGNLMVERVKKPSQKLFNEDLQIQKQTTDSRKQLSKHRQKLMESIGSEAYNGINLFEGVEPMASETPAPQGSVDLGSPRDSGVDISSLMGNASKVWKAMK